MKIFDRFKKNKKSQEASNRLENNDRKQIEIASQNTNRMLNEILPADDDIEQKAMQNKIDKYIKNNKYAEILQRIYYIRHANSNRTCEKYNYNSEIVSSKFKDVIFQPYFMKLSSLGIDESIIKKKYEEIQYDVNNTYNIYCGIILLKAMGIVDEERIFFEETKLNEEEYSKFLKNIPQDIQNIINSFSTQQDKDYVQRTIEKYIEEVGMDEFNKSVYESIKSNAVTSLTSEIKKRIEDEDILKVSYNEIFNKESEEIKKSYSRLVPENAINDLFDSIKESREKIKKSLEKNLTNATIRSLNEINNKTPDKLTYEEFKKIYINFIDKCIENGVIKQNSEETYAGYKLDINIPESVQAELNKFYKKNPRYKEKENDFDSSTLYDLKETIENNIIRLNERYTNKNSDFESYSNKLKNELIIKKIGLGSPLIPELFEAYDKEVKKIIDGKKEESIINTFREELKELEEPIFPSSISAIFNTAKKEYLSARQIEKLTDSFLDEYKKELKNRNCDETTINKQISLYKKNAINTCIDTIEEKQMTFIIKKFYEELQYIKDSKVDNKGKEKGLKKFKENAIKSIEKQKRKTKTSDDMTKDEENNVDKYLRLINNYYNEALEYISNSKQNVELTEVLNDNAHSNNPETYNNGLGKK